MQDHRLIFNIVEKYDNIAGAFHCIMIFLIEKYEDVYAKKKKFKLIN